MQERPAQAFRSRESIAYIVMILIADKKVRRISAFARPGQEISFEEFGDLDTASGRTQTFAFWDMLKEGRGEIIASWSRAVIKRRKSFS